MPLDWFHLTLRSTGMRPLAKRLRAGGHPELATEVLEECERVQWFVWQGNVCRALQVVEDLEVDRDVEDAGPEQRKLLQAVTDFGGYLRANARCIPNSGERERSGEAIASGSSNQLSTRW